jgi:hypothetical protein
MLASRASMDADPAPAIDGNVLRDASWSRNKGRRGRVTRATVHGPHPSLGPKSGGPWRRKVAKVVDTEPTRIGRGGALRTVKAEVEGGVVSMLFATSPRS